MVQAKGLGSILVICGPTAVGKTAQALELAERINAEIVSADSGQVYRGMDIGTAKPTPEERHRVPIHLIDILHPDQPYSAAAFRKAALEKIEDIQSRNKTALIVGGTGLYIKVLEKGIFEGPERDETLRRKLDEEIDREGTAALHQRLERIDPEAALKIPHQNRQRLIRALEVYELTGRPISAFWKEHRFADTSLKFHKIGLSCPKDVLYARVEKRVDDMIHRGLVSEVDQLLKKWGEDAPGLKMIGYKEIVSHLKADSSLEEAIDQIKRNTRHYAKRQMTWFRGDPEIEWTEGQIIYKET